MSLPTQKKPADDWIKNQFECDGTHPGRNKSNWNRWCQSCFNASMQRMVHQEMDQYAAGTLAVVRSEEAIKMDSESIQYWTWHGQGRLTVESAPVMKNPASTETAKPMPSKLGKLLSHLESCCEVMDMVRNYVKVLQGLCNLHRGKAAHDVEEILANIDDEGRGFPYSLAVEFQADVFKVLITGNIAFRAIEVQYWRAFFRKWIPGMKVHLKNWYGMGQSDGWKNTAKASIIGGMVNAEYEAHILHAHDVSSLLKTAETLLAIVKAEIEFCEHILDLIIVVWCTDGGGDCVKMCQLLQMKCTKTPSVAALQLMLEAIKWFNNHSHTLGLLKEQQRAHLPEGEGRVLALLHPCETRWTAHVVSAGHFLKLQKPIRGCILDHRKELVACAGTSAKV
ncbi:hypothetical protein V8D89_016213 [Ganoderma adspersum]